MDIQRLSIIFFFIFIFPSFSWSSFFPSSKAEACHYFLPTTLTLLNKWIFILLGQHHWTVWVQDDEEIQKLSLNGHLKLLVLIICNVDRSVHTLAVFNFFLTSITRRSSIWGSSAVLSLQTEGYEFKSYWPPVRKTLKHCSTLCLDSILPRCKSLWLKETVQLIKASRCRNHCKYIKVYIH